MADVFSFRSLRGHTYIFMDAQDIPAPNVLPRVILDVIVWKVMNSNLLGNFQEIRKFFRLR